MEEQYPSYLQHNIKTKTQKKWRRIAVGKSRMYTRQYVHARVWSADQNEVIAGGAVNYFRLKWGDGRLGEWWAFARESTVCPCLVNLDQPWDQG